jgi:DNA-binding IclR family transcriptional regulator
MVIARDCEIPRSSAHHLLNVMRARNFVAYYEEERAWGLGVAAFEIGSGYLRGAPLQRLGRPVLRDLTQATGETAHLGVLHGADVLYLDKEQPQGTAPRLVTEAGVRLPAHLTAVGMAILADLPDSQIDALFGDQPLVRRTDVGPANLTDLKRASIEVRERGFALDDGMVTPGISCAATSVHSHERIPVASIGVTWVSAQRSSDEVVHAVREAGRALSRSLGWKERAGDR